MKIHNIRTYSRYYPTIIFKDRVHNNDDRIGKIQTAIEGIFPNSMIEIRRKNHKLLERVVPSYDVYIVPQDLYYRFGQQLEFSSFRLSISDDSLAISCWSSRIYRNIEVDGLVVPPFMYAKLWESTREDIYRCSNNNRSFAATWLNYLESLAILAGYYHSLKELASSIGYLNLPELDCAVLKYFFPIEFREHPHFVQLKNTLEHFIHEPYIYAITDYNSDPVLYKAVTRFPSVKFDWRKAFGDILSNSICIDEVIGLLFAKMKISVGALDENDDISEKNFGESYASLYHTIKNSRLRGNNLHISLISSLWEAIDNGSVVCTYENYNLNDANSQRLYFRTGKEIHPYIKLSVLAIAIVENFRELTSNSPISFNKLDQALSMFVVPRSPYFHHQFDDMDTDYVNMPESNGFTLISTNKSSYYLLISFLIRAGIFDNKENGVSARALPNDSPFVFMLRGTRLYYACKEEILPILKLFLLLDRPLFNPLLNCIYPMPAKAYNQYLDRCSKMALDYINGCDLNFPDSSKYMRISIMMHKLQAMIVFLDKYDILSVLGDKYSDIVPYVHKLSEFDKERGLYESAFKVLAVTYHWFLYEAVFLKKDANLASRCFHSLTHIGNVQLDPSLINLFDQSGQLKSTIARVERDEAISNIISIIEKGLCHD